MKFFSIRYCAVIALSAIGILTAKADDDFGLWAEVEVEKSLPHNFDLSFEGEFRTEDCMKQVDRFGATLSLGYKISKFMKVKVGYAMIYSYYPTERKEKYMDIAQDVDDEYKEYYWEGYNITDSYWSLRHRFKADVTFDKKFFKCIKVSLRERYQYTHRPEMEVDRLKYRYVRTPLPEGGFLDELRPGYPESDPDVKHEKNTHYLRSRLEIEWDKKKCDWGPFVSFELYNDLQNSMDMDEYKIMAGTSYKISKNHRVKLSYLFNHNIEDSAGENRHVIVLGYTYKF